MIQRGDYDSIRGPVDWTICTASMIVILETRANKVLVKLVAKTVNMSYNLEGPYKVLFRESQQCSEVLISPEDLLVNLSGLLHYSRAHNGMVYDGVAHVGKDVHRGDLGLKLIVGKWDSVAGWKDNFFRIDGGEYCNVMETVGIPAAKALNRNFGFPITCPIPKGIYEIRNFSTDLLSRYEHFPVFPYGRFRGDLVFNDMKSKHIVGCFRGVSDIVPKT